MTSIKTGFPSKTTILPPKRQAGAARTTPLDSLIDDELMPPAHRGFRNVPSLLVLNQLVERAVAALSRGIIWDRGSILNILV